MNRGETYSSRNQTSNCASETNRGREPLENLFRLVFVTLKRLNHFTNEEVGNNGLIDELVAQNSELVLHTLDSLEDPVRHLADGIL